VQERERGRERESKKEHRSVRERAKLFFFLRESKLEKE